jgi:DNA-binding NarL/FixJ family response regulator
MTPRRIVIVDDHAGFRTTARRLLESDGWSVVGEAADGPDAFGVIADTRPDLVLLDIGLPGLDGFAVAERLTADDPSTPVVLISSHEAATFGPRLATSPALGFLTKSDLDGRALHDLFDGRG